MKPSTHTIEIQLLQNARNIYRVGDEVTGEVIVRPPMDLGVQSLSYYLKMQVEGKGAIGERIVLRKTLAQSAALLKGEEYRYPICFTAPLQETYVGKNTNFKWQLETDVELDEGSEAGMKRKLLKPLNLLKLGTPYEGVNRFVELVIQSKPYHYQVNEQGLVFEGRQSMNWGLMGGVLLAGIFIGFRKDVWLVVGGILTALLLFVLFRYLYAQFLLKRIYLNVGTRDNEFLIVEIQLDKNRASIQELTAGYSIREEVRDQDEGDQKTYDEVIFRSEEKSIKEPADLNRLALLLPENDSLGSCEVGNARVYWVVNMKVKTKLGLTYTYSREIQVAKEFKEA